MLIHRRRSMSWDEETELPSLLCKLVNYVEHLSCVLSLLLVVTILLWKDKHFARVSFTENTFMHLTVIISYTNYYRGSSWSAQIKISVTWGGRGSGEGWGVSEGVKTGGVISVGPCLCWFVPGWSAIPRYHGNTSWRCQLHREGTKIIIQTATGSASIVWSASDPPYRVS